VQVLEEKYRLAILTNGFHFVQRRRLARSEIRPHIAEIIISEEIGVSKPAKKFFDVAFARLGSPSRERTLMIGDGWNSDILGATQYGIDSCWYNPERKPRPLNGRTTCEIAALGELIEWLG
jgi:2-haloacid dehalogenase